MTYRRSRLVLAFLAATAALSSAGQAATSFTFQFDNNGFGTPRGQVQPPIVGTGNFTTSDNLVAGTYALTSLTDFTVSFSFANGATFTQADIATPIGQVAVRISNYSGGGLRLQFTENGSPANGGPAGGSLDLVSSSGLLTFEPSYNGGNDFYFSTPFIGNYLALNAVPEPGSWALMIAGFGLAGAAMRRRSLTYA